MILLYRYFYYLLFFSLSLGAMDIAQLKEMLSSHHFKGDFVLERVDAKLPIPMSFRGIFEIKNNKLLIQVKTPLQINLRLDSTGIFYQAAKDYQRLDGEFDAKLFNRAINFDFLGLGEYFSIRFNGDKKYWTMQLIPKQNMGIRVIEIDGDDFIKNVFVKEANGSTNNLKLNLVLD